MTAEVDPDIGSRSGVAYLGHLGVPIEIPPSVHLEKIAQTDGESDSE
jgi:hypothetical protein